MIYNLSTILRQTMKQTNPKKGKEGKEEKEEKEGKEGKEEKEEKEGKEEKEEKEGGKEKETKLSIVKTIPKYPCNLRIDIELANRKTMELYKKYSAPSLIPKFSILDKDKEIIEKKSNKVVLCICVFAFLAYSYFKKR